MHYAAQKRLTFRTNCLYSTMCTMQSSRQVYIRVQQSESEVGMCLQAMAVRSRIQQQLCQNFESGLVWILENLKIFVDHGKMQKFNKFRASNKAVGPGKKIKVNKCRAYIYSELQSIYLHKLTGRKIPISEKDNCVVYRRQPHHN